MVKLCFSGFKLNKNRSLIMNGEIIFFLSWGTKKCIKQKEGKNIINWML